MQSGNASPKDDALTMQECRELGAEMIGRWAAFMNKNTTDAMREEQAGK